MSTYKPQKPTFAFPSEEVDANSYAMSTSPAKPQDSGEIDKDLLEHLETESALRELSLGMPIAHTRDMLRKKGVNPVSTEYVKEAGERTTKAREYFETAGKSIDKGGYIDLSQPTSNIAGLDKYVDKLITAGLAEEQTDASGRRLGITLTSKGDIAPQIDRALSSTPTPEAYSGRSQSDYFSQLTKEVISQLLVNENGEIEYDGVPYQWAELYDAFYPVVAERAHKALLDNNKDYFNWTFEQSMGMNYEDWYKGYANQRVSEIEQKVIELRDAVAAEAAQIAEGRGREVALSSGTLVPAAVLGWASKEGARMEASKQFDDILESINTFRKNNFVAGLNEGFDWIDALSFGLVDLGTSYSQLQLLEKAKRGEALSNSESKVLELLQLTQEFEGIKNNLGWQKSLGSLVGSGLGSTASMAAGFATGMAATSRIGTTVKWLSNVAKDASKKAAVKQVGKNLIHNFGTAYARGAAVAPFMPSTYTTGLKELQEQYIINADGTIKFEPKSKTLAFLGGYIDTMNEYASEVFGSTLGEILGYGARAFGRVTRLNKAVDAVMSPVNTGLGKAIDKGLSYLPIEDEAKLAGVRKALRGMIVPSAELDEETKELMRLWGVQDGYVAEASSEIFGDLMSQVMRDVVGAKTDYSDFNDSSYWASQLLVAVLYGGSMNTLGHIKEGVSDYQQMVDLGKYNKQLLDKIESKELRNKVLALTADGSIDEMSAQLADIKWEEYHPTDRAKVMDYVRNEMMIQTIAGKVEDGGRVDTFVKEVTKLSGVTYQGKGDLIMETTVGGRQYYIVDGKPADKSESSMLTCIDKETGEKKAILANTLPEQPSIRTYNEVAEQMYVSQFSAEAEATRLSALQSAYDQMERPTAEIARDLMSRMGITPPAEGEVITLADGRKARVTQDLENGEYVVRLEEKVPLLFTIPFYSIQSSNPLTIEAQKLMIEGRVMDNANKASDVASAAVEEGVITDESISQAPEGVAPTTEAANAETEVAQVQMEEQIANDTLDMTSVPTDAEGDVDFDAIEDPKQYAAVYAHEVGNKAQARVEVEELKQKTLESAAKLEEQAKNEMTALAKRKKLKEAKKLRERAAFYDKVLPKFEEMEEEYTSVVKNEYSQQVAEPTLRVLDAMAKKLGIKVRFVDEVRTASGNKANANINGNEVEIAFMERIRSIAFLMGHEFTHRMQELSPEQYAEFKQMVKDFVGEEKWNALVAQTAQAYAKQNQPFTVTLIEDEVTADAAGELVESNDAFLKYLEGKKVDKTFLMKVAEFLRDIVSMFNTANDRERERQYLGLLDGVNKLIESAASAEATDNGQRERLSIIGEQGASALDMAEEATTRIDDLAVAREMETAGKDAKAIRMATGWERGADGLWRFEIPDVLIKRPDEWMGMRNIRLKDIVSGAEDLFGAYPELADVKVKKGRGKGGGSYTHENKTIELGVAHLKGWIDGLRNPSAYYSSYEEIEKGLLRQAAHLRSTLIHEIQHAIQRIEGFAQGGNSAMILDASARAKYDEMIESYNEQVDKYNKMSGAEQRTTEGRDLANRLGGQRKAIDMFRRLNSIGAAGYNRLAGEVEARNVEKRAGMSMAERLATLVEETEDVAREDQIFLREGAEMAMKEAEVSESTERLREQGAIVDAERGDVRYSIADVLTGDQREQAIADLMRVTGRSRRTVISYLKAEESLANIILSGDNKAFLDIQVDESVPSIWSNSDYPQGTVEFSNICRKRLPFTMIYQRLQKDFPNTVFDASSLESIRQTLIANGEEVACGLCFVEDRRQLLGEIGQGFIKALKGETMELNDKQQEAIARMRESGDTYIPNLYELITLDGMKILRKEHPEVANAFVAYNNARGMQAGRLFQAYSAYHRDILNYDAKKVAKINNAGGLRIFSFSDFEAHHLIDLVQVLTDCAAKGIKVQGYTKVPQFAKAVKDTKMKVNRSLIAKAKGVVDADYIPQEGEAVSPNVVNGKRLLFDTVEGIDVNNPNFFDSTDSKSVGNILVGISDEHIRIAMLDPFVDYIIGFHTGLSEAIREQKGIADWTNYKYTQLEKILKDGKLVNADKHGINIYTEVLTPEIKTERQFVRKYLKVCEEKGWIPKYHRFLNKSKSGKFIYTKGYYKLLLDFKMFDANGRILPQEVVVPVFDNEVNASILEEYVEGEKAKAPNDELYGKVVDAMVKRGVLTEAQVGEVMEMAMAQPKFSLITPEMDAAYLDAVERGDMATAQRMVMEAAEKAGYINDESWRMSHRAPRKDEENANPFNTEKIVPEDFWEHPEWYTNIHHSSETRESYYAMKRAIDKYKRLMAEGKTEEAENVTITMYRGVDKTANKREASFRNGDWITPSRSYALSSAPYGKARVISQEVKLKDIWWDGNSINEWGYDDDANYGYRDTKNNRKLLDPVTYDDNGNVIPLSERFNPRKEDIRYSLAAYNGDIERILSDSKAIAKVYAISSDVIVAKSAQDYITALLAYGVPENKIYSDTEAVYLDWEDVIVVNAQGINTPIRLTEVLTHENMHSISHQNKESITKVAGTLPILKMVEYAGNELGYSLDYIKKHFADIPLEVVDEILSTFVESISTMPVVGGGYVLRRYLMGYLTIEDALEASKQIIKEKYGSKYSELTAATMPLLQDNLIKLRDERYKEGKVGNTTLWSEGSVTNGGGFAETGRSEEESRAESQTAQRNGRAEAGSTGDEDGGVNKLSIIHDMTEEDAYKASLLEEAMRMEREATSNGMDIGQEIADATGWVHLANGEWKYYGVGKLEITDKASAERAAFRWLESKKAIKVEQVRKTYAPLIKSAENDEVKAQLEYERDAALAEVDAEYKEIFEDFDNNPDKYIREHQESESFNANLDMYVGSLGKARKEIERMERDVKKRKLSDEEKMAAMRAVKSAIAKELRDGLGRFTRKYDIQRMMDAVNDARTPYAMLRAIDKAMESLFEIKWRKEFARMQMLTKSKISYGVTAIDASSFLNTFVSDHKITAADARKIMNDYWRGTKANGVSVAKYIDDTTRQAMEFISQMAEYGEARARFADIKATEIIAFTRKLREKLEDYTSLNDYKLKTALANDAVRKAIIDAVDILEMYWKAQELQLSLNDDKHRRDISALEIKAKEITAQLREVNQQLRDLSDGKVVVTPSGVKDRDLLRKELQERYNTLLAEREEAYADMYNAMPDIVNLMQQANRAVETLLRTGKVNLAIERTKRKEHEKELIDDVLADLASPASVYKHQIDLRDKSIFERIATGIGGFIASPLGSMDYMLRAIGRNAPMGEGRTYNRFAYAFQKAYDNIYTALEVRKKMLDDKCNTLWGETYHEVHKMAESTKVMTLTYPSAINTEDGKWKPVENTTDIYVTQAMYILATWNQAEGRKALEKQGFTEDGIDNLRKALDAIDPRWNEFADWVVAEYLPSGRERYNAVHRDIFGISMTAVPNYFPIKRAKEELQKEEDVAAGDVDLLPSSVVGAIKERTSNVVPIDLETSFFEALNENTSVMEAWAEMAGLIQDINTILSNRAVKKTMEDINDTLFSDFKKAAQVATLSYIGKTPDIDKKMGTILNRLWAGSKIAFRLNTAFKQLSSALLFAGYAGDPKFQAILLWRYLGGVGKMPVALMNGIIEGASHLTGHSLTNIDIMTNIEWAKVNMPSFAKRWNEGVAGNELMVRTTSGNTSWKQRTWLVKFDDAVREVTKFGMKPNAFIDAFTSAAGARAVYDYAYEDMRKEGYSEEEAHTLAIINAEMAFNTTQQSSEGLYLAPMQMDRSVVATTLSTFMNAPYAMFRNTMIGMKEIFRDAKKELAEIERLEFKRAMDVAKKQVEAQVAAAVARGEYSEEEAKKRRDELFDSAKAKIIPLVKDRAYNKYVKAQTKAVIMVFLNGYAGQLAFNLMGKLPSILFGDDDEEKKKVIHDMVVNSLWEAPLSIIPLGGYVTSMVNGYSASLFPAVDELSKELTTIIKDLREKGITPEVVYTATKMCMRWGLGLSVDTIANIALGLENMIEDGMSPEAILKVMNAPEGQIRSIVGQRREGETAKEYSERLMRFYSILDTPIYEDYFHIMGDDIGERKNDDTPRGMSNKEMERIKFEDAYRRNVILRYGGGERLAEMQETRKTYNKLKREGYGNIIGSQRDYLKKLTTERNKAEAALIRFVGADIAYYEMLQVVDEKEKLYIELYEQFK